ncbi:hypothetical protein [Natrialba sp. PRR66]|uniref:hypothetical protein n=1 Tax=Natrialba sp. PRR66 TaxID=3098146 RepID=UPI002B1E1AF1|nr:hypothetical protein [Natrialba sp. PRR66]
MTRDLGPSFAEMATSRLPPFQPQLTAVDMLGACDTPQVVAALERYGVRVQQESR